MKKILLFLLVLFTNHIYAQIDDSLAKNFRLDFAVPDHPAFNIIDNNDDKILRPGNTQEVFSVVYSNFFKTNSPFIPKNFSMEFAPAQLIGIKKISLSDYMQNNFKRIIYDTKFSIGTKVNDKDSVYHLAAGLRFTWIDNTSLLKTTDFMRDLVGKLNDIHALRLHFIDSLRDKGIMYKNTLVSQENIAQNEELAGHVDTLFRNFYTKEALSIQQIRTKYKDANWNKLKFETAVALRYSSPDSLFKNVHYTKFYLWNTLAYPIKNWGQGLIGLNLSNEKFDSVQVTKLNSGNTKLDTLKFSNTSLSLATRFYAGTNNFKAFLEGSIKYGSLHILQPALNIGAEFNISNGIWAVINFGNNWTKNTKTDIKNWQSNFFWKFDLRFHLPEKKHL